MEQRARAQMEPINWWKWKRIRKVTGCPLSPRSGTTNFVMRWRQFEGRRNITHHDEPVYWAFSVPQHPYFYAHALHRIQPKSSRLGFFLKNSTNKYWFKIKFVYPFVSRDIPCIILYILPWEPLYSLSSWTRHPPNPSRAIPLTIVSKAFYIIRSRVGGAAAPRRPVVRGGP